MKKKVKVIKSDFLITDLPRNRKELFVDILKNQWRNLLLLAFVILIIFIPFIVTRYYNMIIITNLINSNEEENLKSILFNSYTGYNIINIFIITLTGILFGGVSRVFKKLAFNDGLFLGADFVKGIKENFKDFFIISLIYAFVNFILEVLCVNFLLNNNYLYYFFRVIHYFIIFPIVLIWISLSSIYNDKIMIKLKSAYKLYIKYLFKVLFFYILLIIPLLLLTIGNSYVQLFVLIGYFLIYFPIVYLIFILFMNHIFDEQINKKNFPNLVGKGMYRV